MKKLITLLAVMLVFTGCNNILSDDANDEATNDTTAETETNTDTENDVNAEFDAATDSVEQLAELTYSGPICVSTIYRSHASYDSFAAMFEGKLAPYNAEYEDRIMAKLKNLFDNAEFKGIVQNSDSSLQICYSGSSIEADFIFAMYGNFDENNNVVGRYDGENLLLAYENCPPSGDIGLVAITGYINNSLMYRCSGGDGPFGFSKYYLLQPNGDTKKIQDCEFNGGYFDGETEHESGYTCEVDLLETAGTLGF